VFLFNLRAYDRINKTPALEELENEAGVTYHDIQRGIAESIMSDSVHPVVGEEGDKHEVNYDDAEREKEERLARLRRYEEKQEGRRSEHYRSKDSVAHTTMLNGGKMSEEPWEGDPESEKANFVQEELYVHGKVCIVDDRIAICGSANINDRVSTPLYKCLTPGLTPKSHNSVTMIASWPLLLKMKTSSIVRWMESHIEPRALPLHCGDSCGGSI
jgi:phospholipase D1/2